MNHMWSVLVGASWWYAYYWNAFLLLSKFLPLGNFFSYLLELDLKKSFTSRSKRKEYKDNYPFLKPPSLSLVSLFEIYHNEPRGTQNHNLTQSQVSPLNKNVARRGELWEFLLAISLSLPYLVPVSLPLLCKLLHLTVIEVREAAWDEWWEVRSASPTFCHYVTPSHSGSTTDCLE